MTILLLGLVFVSTLVGTLTGFGTSMILVAMLSLFYPLPEVLLFVGIIHLFGDVWKITLFRRGVRWSIVIWFVMPGMLMSLLGAKLVTNLPQVWLIQGLGVALITWAVFSLFNPSWKIRPSRTYAVIGGSLSGFLAGLLGVGGAVRGAFLHAFGLRKEVYLLTAGMTALIIDTTRIGTYWVDGVRLESFSILLLLYAMPVSLMAALLARKLVNYLSIEKFRTIVSLGLILVGISLIFH